ncbi:tetratricopeptide repeat protein [Spirochaetes bacterium]|uniref:Tetratricopeptide repeat protein n=1 Tax=Candidatus Scatousia excrementipullorum TaxID=2840936 RepID=A0A9D9DPB7_9BACT|nr:tetratricopeptide repeat protein [Candidatus Scatousia excrementipullorum]
MKKDAFEKAMGKYYLVTKADSKNVYAITQIARIHDLKLEDKYAKKYYFMAFNIEPKNPHVNYHFGEFYFKRDKLEKAVIHYLIAYNNGYQRNYNLNCRLAIAYDKLGDLKKAKKYYETALNLNPQQQVIKSRLEKINNTDYENSEYYRNIIRE